MDEIAKEISKCIDTQTGAYQMGAFYSYFLFSSNVVLKSLLSLREKYRQTEGISDAAVSQNTNTRIDSNGKLTTTTLNCGLSFNRELIHDAEKNQTFISAAKPCSR